MTGRTSGGSSRSAQPALALAVLLLLGCGPSGEASPRPPQDSRLGGGSAPLPAASTPPGTAQQPGPQPAQRGRVQYVVDGDTLDVAGAGRVRVLGIDTPERGDCAFGPAGSRMKALVLGRQVQLVAAPGKPDTDQYGRLLRYVDIVDGREAPLDAGLELIRAGLAIARYDSRDGYGAHPREAAYVAADEQTPGDPCKWVRGRR